MAVANALGANAWNPVQISFCCVDPETLLAATEGLMDVDVNGFDARPTSPNVLDSNVGDSRIF